MPEDGKLINPEFAAAFVQMQFELPTVKRDSTAEVLMKSGGKFTYSYADLVACVEASKPVVHKHGFAISQLMGYAVSNGEPVSTLITMLMHKCGYSIEGEQLLTLKSPDPQGQGSAITYARRYGWCAILGIVTDDDDGAAAMQAHYEQKEVEQKKSELPECPQCGELNLRQDKNDSSQWYCWKAKGGCGYKGSKEYQLPDDMQEAGNYSSEARVDNPNKPEPTKEQWDDLKAAGIANKWPEGFMKLSIDAKQRETRDKAVTFKWADEKFSKLNTGAVEDESEHLDLLAEAEQVGF